ncbi:stalk domain-containing protein [Thermotalea metallivorans]|uniref:Big-1 domain-containing protein n=1 Tax=Thermotalea metallivorans TaxID=520762 RepID=A0A140L6Q3_9FIRM|nr:stalk domain-containing protein [Thermotalea metallivorans]KXG76228.1 hypothetical protein AN619_11850 [Thermotalea metallivorans]
MKRKLSLLLALVMILSLVPMTAFAAPANRFASTLDVDKTSVVADGESVAKFTLYLFDSSNNPAVGEAVYVASKRFTGTDTDIFTDNNGNSLPSAGGGLYYATANNDGKVTIKVKSSVAGTAKIGFGTLPGDMVGYLNGDKNVNENTVGLIGTKDITFTADSIGGMTATVTATSPSNPSANGLDYFEVTFTAKTSGGAPISGETIKVSASSSAVTFNATEKTTNSAGKATFKVYSTKPGTFTIEGKSGNKTASVNVTFKSAGLYNVERVSTDGQVVAKNSTKSFKFKLVDVNGNMFKVASVNNGASKVLDAQNNQYDIETEVVDEPDNSAITLTLGKYSDGHLKITTSEIKHEGAYKIRVKLPNGKYADVNFTAKKQGDIVKIELSYDETTLPLVLNAKSGDPTVDSYDANNVKKSLSASDVTFVSSNPNLISVDSNGILNVATNDKDDIGKEVVITAIDTSNNLRATYTIKLGGRISGTTATAPENTLVGETARIEVKMLDEKGNVVAVGQGSNTTFKLNKAVVISKPEGAIVSAEEAADFSDDLKAYGKAGVEVTSTKAGNVELQLIIDELDAGNQVVRTYTAAVTVKFGDKPVVKPVIGAKSLVLTIGQTVAVKDGAVATMDVAPFIRDGRTFVPVRFIAESLGAEVSFTQNAQGLTETVTLTRPDMTVTMTIGSTTITVVKDGKSTTVTSDVAPFIESGRTVLPFRALAEAMGATVNYGMNADNTGVAWVSFEQK